jgi:hypothetical protein
VSGYVYIARREDGIIKIGSSRRPAGGYPAQEVTDLMHTYGFHLVTAAEILCRQERERALRRSLAAMLPAAARPGE